MTEKLTAGAPLPDSPGLAPEQVLALRHELCKTLKTRRLAEQPRLTQNVLSQRLGYPYSVVTGWENYTRLFYKSNVLAWATELGYSVEEVTALLATYEAAILPDDKAGISTGSRIETEVNDRVKVLRKERRLSIREMAEITGISTGHWQRIEINQSNLSVAQIRQIGKQLKVSYEWLIDGKGEPSQQTMQQTIDRLIRDNEVLESFRLLVEGQKRRIGH